MKKFMSVVFAFALLTAAASAFADTWYCSSNNDWYGQSQCTVKSVRVWPVNGALWLAIALDGSATCDVLRLSGFTDTQAKAMEALALTALTSGKMIRFRKTSDPTTTDGKTFCYGDQISLGGFN